MKNEMLCLMSAAVVFSMAALTVGCEPRDGGKAADVASAVATGTAKIEKSLDPAMAKWRCVGDNATIEAVGEVDGRMNVLRFAYPEKAGVKNGSVNVASYDLRYLLGPWIPPYVGMRAKKVVCDVRTVSASGKANCSLQCRANQSWYASHWKYWTATNIVSTSTGVWSKVTVDLALDYHERLADIQFLFKGAGACKLEVAKMRVVLDDGSEYALVRDDPPKYRTGMVRPCETKPIRPFPTRPRIQFGFGGHWVVEYRDSLAAIGDYMKKYLPEYDIVLSLGNSFDPRVIDSMKIAPPNIFFQQQGGQHDLRYAGLKDALVKTRDGKPQTSMFNSSVGTHPLFREAWEDEIAYLGTMGFNNLQRYDYVWYYPAGPSGFDAASIAAFREDLLEKDEGLDLVADRIRPARRIHFWDYYCDYHGERLDPSALGYSSWSEFQPKLDKSVGERLYWTLVAYEWLRLAQHFGEWTEKYCYGARYDYLLNGEFSGNGNDHVYLTRLRTSGVCSPEFFSGALKQLGGYYHGAGLFLRNAQACGKSFGITVETSRGGSGSQPYWSAKTGYALCYFLSALGFDGFEYDGLPGPAAWSEYVSGKKPFNTAELYLGMADARGYRQAKLDGAKPRPLSGIYQIVNRTVLGWRKSYYRDSQKHGEFADFRYELACAELDYARTDPLELPAILDKAKVFVVSPDIRREIVENVLVPWSKEPGHLLVTNKAELDAFLAKSDLPRIQKPSPKGLAPVEVLPFDCREGSVAVLFNRKACAEADRNKWYEGTWRPVVYKRTFDPAKILYFDKVPNAAARAEIPVKTDGAYRIYRLISGREEVVEAKGGYLRLDLGDDLTDVFYYGLDGAAYRAFLETVRKERVLTADFFKNISK